MRDRRIRAAEPGCHANEHRRADSAARGRAAVQQARRVGPQSGLGQTEKSGRSTGGSAFPSGTDMVCRACLVRFVPNSDIITLVYRARADAQPPLSSRR